MIELIDRFTPTLTREIEALLRAPELAPHAAGELDPRWLAALHHGLGHEPLALLARSDGPGAELRGYLPLARVSSRLFGRFLVSLPYLNRAGVLAPDDKTRAELIDAAVSLTRRLDADYLELRSAGRPDVHPRITHRLAEKHRMLLELPGSADALWTGLSAKVRNQVRKADRHALTLRFGGAELVEAFYSVFAVNMRDLGTPVYPRRLFDAILTHLGQTHPGQDAELAIVSTEGIPIAGALLVHDRLTPGGLTQVPSASCLRAFNATNANMWLYHGLLRRAIQRGSRTFDFGRSSEGSGTWRFKRQWGAQPHPTTWQYHLRRGELNTARPTNPRYQRKIQAWRKLPVWVTRALGPTIIRGIP